MPATKKLVFENGRGERLAASLDSPRDEPLGWALFAHCFTCSKDIPAAGRIRKTSDGAPVGFRPRSLAGSTLLSLTTSTSPGSNRSTMSRKVR